MTKNDYTALEALEQAKLNKDEYETHWKYWIQIKALISQISSGTVCQEPTSIKIEALQLGLDSQQEVHYKFKSINLGIKVAKKINDIIKTFLNELAQTYFDKEEWEKSANYDIMIFEKSYSSNDTLARLIKSLLKLGRLEELERYLLILKSQNPEVIEKYSFLFDEYEYRLKIKEQDDSKRIKIALQEQQFALRNAEYLLIKKGFEDNEADILEKALKWKEISRKLIEEENLDNSILSEKQNLEEHLKELLLIQGKYLEDQKDYKSSLDYFLQYYSINGEYNPTLYYSILKSYLKIGNCDSCKNFLEEILNKYPLFKDSEQYKQISTELSNIASEKVNILLRQEKRLEKKMSYLLSQLLRTLRKSKMNLI